MSAIFRCFRPLQSIVVYIFFGQSNNDKCEFLSSLSFAIELETFWQANECINYGRNTLLRKPMSTHLAMLCVSVSLKAFSLFRVSSWLCPSLRSPLVLKSACTATKPTKMMMWLLSQYPDERHQAATYIVCLCLVAVPPSAWLSLRFMP